MAPGERGRSGRGVCWILLALAVAPTAAARREKLALRHVTLELPGPPARVIPADMNRDGRTDLVVVVAYTEIEVIGEHRVENLVQMTRVIPALFDRREVRLYLAQADGTYAFVAPPLALPQSVLHLEPGVNTGELLALTDDGLSRLTSGAGEGGAALSLLPLLQDEPVLAGSAAFYATLELVHDLDGDGISDVLLPSKQGLTVYLGSATGLVTEPVERIELSRAWERGGDSSTLWYPYPEVREIDGDGFPDLVFTRWNDEFGSQLRHVFLGEGGGRFRPLRSEPRDCHDTLSELRTVATGPPPDPGLDDLPALGRLGNQLPDGGLDSIASTPALDSLSDDLAALRDIDGDGRAEAVLIHEQSRGDGMRKELKDAKRPRQLVHLHRLTADLDVAPDPYYELKVVGHAATVGTDDAEGFLPAGLEQFIDLDGNGREDLVTLTLDFSVFQLLKIMMTKKVAVGVNFHVYAQQQDGTFVEVPDLDLHEKLKFDLNRLELGRFAQFAGDFDGDGRQEFVHFGHGDVITIHRGQPGCRYPKNPDLSIKLVEEPRSLDLIEIEDLDGDGRSDLRITRPFPSTDPDVTAPVAVDLYLSGGGS